MSLPQRNGQVAAAVVRTHDPIARLVDLARLHPRRLLWAFIVLHAVVWALFGTFTHHVLRRDVLEMLAWGHEWQLGYYKHPPLPAWLLEAAAWATGRAHWAPYVVAEAFMAGMFWALWKLAAEIADETRALVAVVAIAGIGSVTYEALNFNHNIAQMPLWALVALYLHRGLRHGRTGDWLWLGLWMGLAMLAKYETLILLVPLAAFALLHPAARRSVATPGPWLATALALVVFSPNLIWLLTHDPIGTADYLASRTSNRYGALGHLIYPLDFAVNQIANVGPALVALLALRGLANLRHLPQRHVERFDAHYAGVLALGPFALATLLSAATGVLFKEAWGIPMAIFVGLIGVIYVSPAIDERAWRRLFGAGIAASMATLSWTFFSQSYYEPRLLNHIESTQFPGPEVGAELSAGWRQATGNAPLRYVIGEMYFASIAAYYAPDRPSVYDEADPVKSPWIDEADLRRRGAVLVWPVFRNNPGPPREYATRFPAMVIQEPLRVFANAVSRTRPITFAWAILPPQQ